ncbi:transcriptional regulator [Solibacillus isronensis]|uniref:transcriptional regulator n=1 Tax=Solibacillus isronensis TaxID=412383 RepID=UPI0009A6FF56|nr:transcriptional regulator [Solibacillus isronensis]
MREQLIKAMQQNQILDIMYIAKDQSITKRRIKLIKISGEHVQAYCFSRHAKRNFIVDNILAVHPVNKKARGLEA